MNSLRRDLRIRCLFGLLGLVGLSGVEVRGQSSQQESATTPAEASDAPAPERRNRRRERRGPRMAVASDASNRLRGVIDDDAMWWRLQREFFQKFKYQNIMTEDVAAFFNEQTGLELTPIFNQYLRRAEIPVLELQFNGGGGRVEYRWRAEEPGFAMPIKVGRPKAWQVITPTNEWQTLEWTLESDEFEVATDLYYVGVERLPGGEAAGE